MKADSPFSCFRGRKRLAPLSFRSVYPSYRILPNDKGVLSVQRGDDVDIVKLTRSYRSTTGVYNQVRIIDGERAIVTSSGHPFFADVSGMPEQKGDSEQFQKAQAANIAHASGVLGTDISKMTFEDVLKLISEKSSTSASSDGTKEEGK